MCRRKIDESEVRRSRATSYLELRIGCMARGLSMLSRYVWETGHSGRDTDAVLVALFITRSKGSDFCGGVQKFCELAWGVSVLFTIAHTREGVKRMFT